FEQRAGVAGALVVPGLGLIKTATAESCSTKRGKDVYRIVRQRISDGVADHRVGDCAPVVGPGGGMTVVVSQGAGDHRPAFVAAQAAAGGKPDGGPRISNRTAGGQAHR